MVSPDVSKYDFPTSQYRPFQYDQKPVAAQINRFGNGAAAGNKAAEKPAQIFQANNPTNRAAPLTKKRRFGEVTTYVAPVVAAIKGKILQTDRANGMHIIQ